MDSWYTHPMASLPSRTLAWWLRQAATGAAIGLGIATLAGAGHRQLPGGAATGVAMALLFAVGVALFRSWQPGPRVTASPARVGWFVVLKLVVLWGLGMAVILPTMHFGFQVPVLRSLRDALPTLAISLMWLTVLLAADTASELFRTGERLARSEARAHFLTLRAQLQPHTLFNALNGIAGLVRQDPLGAEEATRRLASLLRRVLEALEQEHWTLEEEFQVIRDLLGLESLRFGPRLSAEVALDPGMATLAVPPLSILPLVENSLRHGFRQKAGPCALSLVARDGAVTLRDDGLGLAPGWKEGVGLRTVRERLALEGAVLELRTLQPGCEAEVRWP